MSCQHEQVLQVNCFLPPFSARTSHTPHSHPIQKGLTNNTECAVNMKECYKSQNASNQTAGKICNALWSIFCHAPSTPVLFSFSVCACSSDHGALHFPMHPSLITNPPPRPSNILSASQRQVIIIAGQQKYLVPLKPEAEQPCCLCTLSLSWTPCTPGSSKPSLTLEINSPVSRKTIHSGQLRGSLVLQVPMIPLVVAYSLPGFMKLW